MPRGFVKIHIYDRGQGSCASHFSNGVRFIEQGELYRLTQDYTFNSPSTAAGVLLGRTANGRIEWKDSKGRTLKEIQEAVTGEA